MKRCVLILAALLLTACAVAQEAPKEAPAKAPAAIAAGKVEHGKVERINETWVVSVWGTPKQMGNAYGTLLGPVIKRVISDLIHNGFGKEEEAYANIRRGSRTMAEHQPKEFIAELRACAEAAKVDLDDLLMLQYFGDVRRAIKGPGASFLCTSFAIMPPWTRGKRCIVGRNLDYFDHGVGNYASILAHYRPTGRIPFVTVTWVGVANGWTLLNEKGIVCSNNTALGDGKHSLEGISTCYLLRVVAENADTVAKGVAMVKKGPRACGTNMLIAGGEPMDAAICEFDHERIIVRKPTGGFVGAANSFQTLLNNWGGGTMYWGRLGVVRELMKKHRGRIDVGTDIAGAEGVPITGMNLHSAMVDCTDRRLRVRMGKIPAHKLPARTFRLTDKGVVADEPEANPY